MSEQDNGSSAEGADTQPGKSKTVAHPQPDGYRRAWAAACPDCGVRHHGSVRCPTKPAGHLATCGAIGWSGRRCGTRYAHTPQAVRGMEGEPWFRFRNETAEAYCRAVWLNPAPESGDYFVVADEAERPQTGWSSRSDDDVPPELGRCALARWEGELRRGRLWRIGKTDFYEWSEKRSDYAWHPYGRLLKLNKDGRALVRAAAEKARTDSSVGTDGCEAVGSEPQ